MAGAVEQGFEDEPQDDEGGVKSPTLVTVETEMFTAQVIGMLEMPGMKVLDVITTPGLAQLPKMVDLFFLAIYEPEKADTALLLNFIELNEAVGQWVAKSMKNSPKIDFGFFE